ncbi:Bromodomain containing protein [Trichomonas vaginalis G3]|uniref:Bromodomain containing protein n=1 Tax=Trichomonas vaginalis (strain ATCC PRA-98 / G3) TaxID=412133 RepID=A2EE05_TRIV3|nr:chromatin organization [Trichomonas vaginalis G3]EAY09117.1 Bromodomain containing protein [Trichomonas vaginalis G3]KAI5502651.1 chromatin organization [Trichomonas vaginalis G3]|eukprot:XP_001321340.1 Bromodomain containing protein [Trichomonas vaginalis G3]
MQEEQQKELLQEMDTMMKDEMYVPFNDFLGYVSEEYHQKIARPIDLNTVKANLENRQYHRYIDWYHDMELVFKNTIEFYKNEQFSPYPPMATYLLSRLQEKFGQSTYSSINEWLTAISKQMNEISELLAKSPVPQGIDPMIPQIIKTTENKPEPNANEKAYMADHFNKVLDDPDIHRNVHYIIKTINPTMEITDKLVIENLNEHTLCALHLYMETVWKISANDSV